MTTYDPGPVPPAVAHPDPLDWITWPQYRVAFMIATAALGEIALGRDAADPAVVAAAALEAIRGVVRRYDDTEPSWVPVYGTPGTPQ